MAKKVKQKTVTINGEVVEPVTKHKLWEKEGWSYKKALDLVRQKAAEQRSSK